RRRLLRERRGVRIGSAFEKAFGNLVDAASAHRRDFRQIENIGDDAARALSVERAQGGEKSGALIRAAAFTAIPGKTRDKLAEIIGPPEMPLQARAPTARNVERIDQRVEQRKIAHLDLEIR